MLECISDVNPFNRPFFSLAAALALLTAITILDLVNQPMFLVQFLRLLLLSLLLQLKCLHLLAQLFQLPVLGAGVEAGLVEETGRNVEDVGTFVC